MQIAKIIASVATILSLVGCAHPLVITPDVGKIERSTADQPIKKNVGYYIPAEMRNREVTTPGGGGDMVTYAPYRDLELGIYKMLSNVFANVTKLGSANDKDAIEKNKIDYVITPQLVTNSSSPSPFTWPPTQFMVEMSCTVNDPAGKVVFSKKVMGQGQAEFDEFKKDFSLSGKRAAQDALLKMQNTLLGAQELRQ